MKLIDDHNDSVEFTATPFGGEHATLLTVKEDGTDASFVLSPSAALALGNTLVAWAQDRMEKEGLF